MANGVGWGDCNKKEKLNMSTSLPHNNSYEIKTCYIKSLIDMKRRVGQDCALYENLAKHSKFWLI